MTAAAHHYRTGEGRTFQLGRITLTFKTSATDTEGAYSLCEAIEPPGAEAGLHRHSTYDETHIICEGRSEYRLGDAKLIIAPGEMNFAVLGKPQTLKILVTQNGG